MKIVRFTPGDATAYFVLFHRLTADERNEIGGLSEGAVWFGFGLASLYEFNSHPFQGKDSGYLDISYYLEKMAGKERPTYTDRVGHRVLCYLTDRQMDYDSFASYTKSQFDDWDDDWQTQLEPLKGQ